MFFSSMDNLTMPDKGINMGDGWETKRNRKPGNFDWVIIRLAKPGVITSVLLDTAHFKGNYPDRFSLEACFCKKDDDVIKEKVFWQEILSSQKLGADQEHFYTTEIHDHQKVSHVKLKIFPDGGVSRLRLFGNFQS